MNCYYYLTAAADSPRAHELLAKVAATMQLELRALQPSDFERTVASLWLTQGSQACSSAPTQLPHYNLLLLQGLSDEQVYEFLAFLRALKGKGLPSIPLRAVVTENNKAWLLRDLVAELEREHLFYYPSST